MRSPHDSVDDLLVLARRGDLVDGDERRLRDALASSPDAQARYDAGKAFDAEGAVLAGDDERIERIARNVEKRLAKNKGLSRRRWIVQLAIAAALIVGAAIGANELTKGKPAPLPPAATTTPSVEQPAVSVSVEPPPVAVLPPPEPLPSVVQAPRRIVVDAGAVPTAAELFAAANRARMQGETARAIELSRQLEDRYPMSEQAKTTHLSLGMLYLQEDRAVDALAELKLAHATGGATVPDAIWGESQALRRLGRTTEERSALEELLTTYPQSAYAGAARKRLAELP